jgi:hypothetical protein
MPKMPTAVRVRRLAEAQTLRLERSWVKDRDVVNHGSLYRLRTASGIVLLGEGYTAPLEDIEAFLISAAAQQA